MITDNTPQDIQEYSTLREEANGVTWRTHNMYYNVHYITLLGRVFTQFAWHGEDLFRRLAEMTQEEQRAYLAEVEARELDEQARAIYSEELFADPPPWPLPVWEGNEEHYRQRVRAGEYEALRQRQEEKYRQSEEYQVLEQWRARWARMGEELRQQREAGELVEAREPEKIIQLALF